MTTLHPSTVSDCIKLMSIHEMDIKTGLRDIQISSSFIKDFHKLHIIFLAAYSPLSAKILAASPLVDSTILEDLIKKGNDEIKVLVLENTGNHQSLKIKILEDFSSSISLHLREKSARHTFTPPKCLDYMAQYDTAITVRKFAINNPYISKDTLVIILKNQSDDIEIRKYIAKKYTISIQGLKEMIQNENNTEILESLLENKSLPSDVLPLFVAKRSFELNELIVQLEDVDSSLLHEITYCATTSIIMLIAKHPKTSTTTLDIIASSTNDIVMAGHIIENKNVNASILKKISESVQDTTIVKKIINHSLINGEILETILTLSTDRSVLTEIIKSKVINNQILSIIIASNSDHSVFIEILALKNVDDTILREIANKTNDSALLSVIINNSNISNYTFSFLYSKGLNNINLLLAQNKKTPIELLRKLTNQQNTNIRLGVAKNESTTENLLYTLAADVDYEVKKAAQNHPNYNITERKEAERRQKEKEEKDKKIEQERLKEAERRKKKRKKQNVEN